MAIDYKEVTSNVVWSIIRFLVTELQLRFLFSVGKDRDFYVNFLKCFLETNIPRA